MSFVRINIICMLLIMNLLIYYFLFIPRTIPMNYLFLGVLSIAYLLGNRIRIYKREFFFLSIILFSLLSLLYSADKTEGLQKTIALIIIYISMYKFLFYRVDEKYLGDIVNVSFWISIVYLTICFFTFNDYIVRGIYVGTTLNQHNSSILLALSFMFVFSYISYTRFFLLKLIAIGVLFFILFLLISSYARVGFLMIGFFMFFIFLYEFITSDVRKKIIYLFFIISISVLFFFFFYDLIILKFSNVFDYINTKGLSGRDYLIYTLLNRVFEEPIFIFSGFGVGAIDVPTPGLALRDAGSVFVVLYEGGVTLLFLWFILIFRYLYVLFYLYKKNRIPQYVKFFLFIPASILFNVSDAAWVQYSNVDTIIMFLGIMMTEKFYYIEKKIKIGNVVVS